MSQESFIPENDPIQEVSSKSTKNEIFEAYQNLLNKVKGTKQESHQTEVKRKQEADVVEVASNMTKDCI